jgi:hypothetical protein
MMRASSSADHLLCFLAGDSDGCAGILRLVPAPPLPSFVVTYDEGSDDGGTDEARA